MKKILIFTALVFTLVVGIVFPIWADVVISQVNEAPDFDFWQWLISNWAIVALVLSELAALLPTKVSGIIHLLVTIMGKIINKSK